MGAQATETHMRAFTLASYRLAASGSLIRLMEKKWEKYEEIKKNRRKDIVANTRKRRSSCTDRNNWMFLWQHDNTIGKGSIILTEIGRPGRFWRLEIFLDRSRSFCSRFIFASTFFRRALVVVLSLFCIVSFPWFLSRVKSVHFS